MGFFHSLNSFPLHPFPASLGHLRVGFIEIPMRRVPEQSKTCAAGLRLQLNVAILGCPTSLPLEPAGPTMSFVMALTTHSTQEATNLLTRLILKVVKPIIPLCLTTVPVLVPCRWISCAQNCFGFHFSHLIYLVFLDYLNSLVLTCLWILFSMLLLSVPLSLTTGPFLWPSQS